jgi:hypothetical protein
MAYQLFEGGRVVQRLLFTVTVVVTQKGQLAFVGEDLRATDGLEMDVVLVVSVGPQIGEVQIDRLLSFEDLL